MTVPAQTTTRTTAVGNGITTQFSFDFLCLEARDVRVSVSDVVVDPSQYTVSGLGQHQGGAVTFLIAPAYGVPILMELAVVADRLTDYQHLGDFMSKTVNFDFDRIWLSMQGALGNLRRALQLGTYDVDGTGSYRANGNRIRDVGRPETTTDAARKQDVVEMLADLSTDGSGQFVVERLADTADSDNGAAMVGIKVAPTSVTRTLLERAQDVINVKDWGAKGNWDTSTQTGDDDTSAIQAVISYLQGIGDRRKGGKPVIYFPPGNYKLSSVSVPFSSSLTFGVVFVGDGAGASNLWFDGAHSGPGINCEVEGVLFRDLAMFGALREAAPDTEWKPVLFRCKQPASRNFPDIDVTFQNCVVGYADAIAEIFGRGFVFNGGNVNHVQALLNIVCSTDTVFGSTPSNSVETGMRHYTIRNVRFDIVEDAIIKVTGDGPQIDYINDILVEGNDFVGVSMAINAAAAGLNGVVLSGNNSINSFDRKVVLAKKVTSGQDIGNNWTNWYNTSFQPVNTRTDLRIPWLWEAVNNIEGLIIDGVLASHLMYGAVRAPGACKCITISNCVFPHAFTSPPDAGRTLFSSDADCTNLVIENNQFAGTGQHSGVMRLFNNAVQTAKQARVFNNLAPWNWSVQHFSYTPVLYVGSSPSATAASQAQGRYYVSDGFVHATFSLQINPSETSGDLSVSLPPVAAIAENQSITSNVSGRGLLETYAGLSVTDGYSPYLRINATNQRAELYYDRGLAPAKITAVSKTGVIILFGFISYRC